MGVTAAKRRSAYLSNIGGRERPGRRKTGEHHGRHRNHPHRFHRHQCSPWRFERLHAGPL